MVKFFLKIVLIGMAALSEAAPGVNFSTLYRQALARQVVVETSARLNFSELRQKYFHQIDQDEQKLFRSAGLEPDLMRGLASCARQNQLPCQHPSVIKFKGSEPKVIQTAESLILMHRMRGAINWQEQVLRPLPQDALTQVQQLGSRLLNTDDLEPVRLMVDNQTDQTFCNRAEHNLIALSPAIIASFGQSARYHTSHKVSNLWAQKVILHEFGHIKFMDAFIQNLMLELKVPVDFRNGYDALAEKRADLYGVFSSDYPLATALLNLSMPRAGHPYKHRSSKNWEQLVWELEQSNLVDAPISKSDFNKIDLDLRKF